MGCERGRPFLLAAGLLTSLWAHGGGVILDRAALASGGKCQQGAVQWVGAGSMACPAARQRADGAQGSTVQETPAPAVMSTSAAALTSRRQVLLQELAQERDRLAGLSRGGRDAGTEQAMNRSLQDILALERELSRLAP